jgi:ABC-type sugar transport system permease subunit
VGPLLRRYRFAVPYLLLAPGLIWLTIYYIYPTFQMFIASFWSGSVHGFVVRQLDYLLTRRATRAVPPLVLYAGWRRC